jgi:hypothetical protein
MLFVLFNFIVLEGNAKIAKKVNFLFKEGKDKKERWVKRMVMKVGSFELGVLSWEFWAGGLSHFPFRLCIFNSEVQISIED